MTLTDHKRSARAGSFGARGRCPDCGDRFQLRQDGALHGHGGDCQGKTLWPLGSRLHGPETRSAADGCQCRQCQPWGLSVAKGLLRILEIDAALAAHARAVFRASCFPPPR